MLVVGSKDMIRVKDLKKKSLRNGYYPHSSIAEHHVYMFSKMKIG